MDAFSQTTGLYPLSLPTPFPVGPVNVFLLKGEPLTLIDAGPRTDEAYDALAAALAEHKLQVSDIERIILTHHHVDHIGLLTRLMEESGAESWAHPKVRTEEMPHESEEEARRQFYHDVMTEFGVPQPVQEESMALWGAFRVLSEPFRIDHVFQDGAQAGPFTTYFVPGHSATDTLLVNDEGNYSIVGDHLLQTINPNPLIRRPERPGAPRQHSLVQFQLSLVRARQLDLGKCFPGHGPHFDDHRTVVDGLLAKHERRNQRVLASIGPQGSTVYEVASVLYPDVNTAYLYLALSVATGHLELLVERGVLEAWPDGEQLRYGWAGAARALAGA